jgi:DNA polymerase elongation subunit (family B)
MEGKKSDRPRWITRVFEQFVQDFKDAADPTSNIKRAVNDLESRRVDTEDLKIFVTLSKDPTEYAGNTVQKRVGLKLGAKKGDVIYYYKTDAIGKKKDAAPINTEDISISEYKKALLTTVKDALEIMGFGYEDSMASNIFNVIDCRRQKNSKHIQTMAARMKNEEAGRST